jgi:hydroxyquinol 1,2-dioxygenase
VTTHRFVADSQFQRSYAVFGMKESLVVKYERHPAGTDPYGEPVDTPLDTVSYDFKLRPSAA